MSEPNGMKQGGPLREERKREAMSGGMEQMRKNFLEALATALGVAPSQAKENAERVSMRTDLSTLWGKFEGREEGNLNNEDVRLISEIGEWLTKGVFLKKKEDAYSVGLHALKLFKTEPTNLRLVFEKVKEKLSEEWGAAAEAKTTFDKIAGRGIES